MITYIFKYSLVFIYTLKYLKERIKIKSLKFIILGVIGIIGILYITNTISNNTTAKKTEKNNTDKFYNIDSEESTLLDEYSFDLNSDGISDGIKLIKSKNNLNVKVNKSVYVINDVYSGDNTFFANAPSLKVIENNLSNKYLYVNYSYEVNGGTDGFYKGKVFKYDKGTVKEIWNTNLDYEDITLDFQDVEFNVKFSEYKIDKKYLFDMSSLKDNKTKKLLTETKELAKAVQEDNAVKIYDAENLKYYDYNDDGVDEIIVQNPIYFHNYYSYIVSLYTIWAFEDNKVQLKKIFLLDRYSDEAKIIRHIISNGYIDKNDIINNGSLMSLKTMVENNILLKKDNIYKLYY